ncbi:PorP/SprF family type IX secretion system membrane protein [Marinoscillum pacificum]|uniref:PorP/SprF family type IX secretion system membrane protein n=1 Tax=Marinoscillum pacificum TaxID=392723 RepID=UPI00215876E9|nr:PorP/SprF family type IX secretion system membrane protein [Marinoscillum pacificum]
MTELTNKKYSNGSVIAFLILLSGLWSQELRAQQLPLYAHYYLNPYLYNPAMAGYAEQSSAYFLYRKQWAGVDGAPETQVFTLDGNLKNYPVGLGVTFINDVTNILGRTGGALTGSYEVNLTPIQTLRFGMSFQAIRNKVFFDRIRAEDISDPNLLENVDARTVFEGAVGLSYSIKNLRIGFSGDQLFQNTFDHDEQAAFRTLDYTLVRHYYTTAQYLFEVGPNVTITPQVLIRTIQGLKSQYDGYVKVGYKDFIWTNLMYRHDIGAGASLGFKLDDQYVFSYAYEFPTTDLNIVGSSTHEFMLGIKIRGGSGGISNISQDQAKELMENSVYQEKIDALAQQNEQVSNQLSRTERQLRTQNQEIERLREVVETYQSDLKKTIEELQAKPDDIDQLQGYYVVVGALHKMENAKIFQKVMKREANLDTRLVQNANKTWYFIYSDNTDSVKEALQKLEVIKSGPAMPFIIEEPWIYKKEER